MLKTGHAPAEKIPQLLRKQVRRLRHRKWCDKPCTSSASHHTSDETKSPGDLPRGFKEYWSRRTDLNRSPADYESGLVTEARSRLYRVGCFPTKTCPRGRTFHGSLSCVPKPAFLRGRWTHFGHSNGSCWRFGPKPRPLCSISCAH